MKLSDLGFLREDIDPSNPNPNPKLIRDLWGRFKDAHILECLRQIVLEHELHFPRLMMVKDGNILEGSQYIRSRNNTLGGDVASHADLLAIETLLADGYSLVLDRLHTCCLPILELRADLQAAFRAQVESSVFLARSGIGYGTHWDDVHILALQFSGRKKWKLAKATNMVGPNTVSGIEPPDSLQWEYDFVLGAGDALFVPKGWWHLCETVGNEGSLHVSMGYAPLSIGTLVRLALGEKGEIPLPYSGDRLSDMRVALNEIAVGFANNFPAKIAPPSFDDVLNQRNSFRLL